LSTRKPGDSTTATNRLSHLSSGRLHLGHSKAVEYITVTFELSSDSVAVVMPGDLDLGSHLTILNKNERWEVVDMTGRLGGAMGAQRKGVVLLGRQVEI